MKKQHIAFYFSCLLLFAFVGCKKNDVDSQALVQQKLLGKWPLKYNVRTIYTDAVSSKPDTLITYNPIDTLVFSTDGMATLRNKTIISSVPYSVDANGENITFNSTPVVTLQITFIRNESIGFGKETFANVAGQQIRTVIDDHYVKN